MRGFAQELLATEYVVELSARETIETVVVTDRFDVQRTLPESAYQYDREGSRFTLDPAHIRSSDRRLSIEIQVHCRPVAR